MSKDEVTNQEELEDLEPENGDEIKGGSDVVNDVLAIPKDAKTAVTRRLPGAARP